MVVGLALLGLAPAAIGGQAWYVEGNTGSPSNNGKSWGTAFRYMLSVNSVISPGDTVYCRNLNLANPSDTVSNNYLKLASSQSRFGNTSGWYDPTFTKYGEERRTFIIGKVGAGNDWTQADTLAYTLSGVVLDGVSYVTVKGFRIIKSGWSSSDVKSVEGFQDDNSWYWSPARWAQARRDSVAFCRIDSAWTIQGAPGFVMAHCQLNNKLTIYAEAGAVECNDFMSLPSGCTSPTYKTRQVAAYDTIRACDIHTYASGANNGHLNGIELAGMGYGFLMDSCTVDITGLAGTGGTSDPNGWRLIEFGMIGADPNYFRYNTFNFHCTADMPGGTRAFKIRSHSSNNHFVGNKWYANWGKGNQSVAAELEFTGSAGDTMSKCQCVDQGYGEKLWTPDNNTWDGDEFYLSGYIHFQSDQTTGHMNNCIIVSNRDPAMLWASAQNVNYFQFKNTTFVGKGTAMRFGEYGYNAPNLDIRQCVFYSDSLVSTVFDWNPGHSTPFSSQFALNNCLFFLNPKSGAVTANTAYFCADLNGKTPAQSAAATANRIGALCATGDPYFLNRDLNHQTFNPYYRLQGSSAANGTQWLSGTCLVPYERPPCYAGGGVPQDSIRPAGAVITSLSANSGSTMTKTLTWTDSGDDSLVLRADSVYICELPTTLPPGDDKFSNDPSSAFYWKKWAILSYKATTPTTSGGHTYTLTWTLDGTTPMKLTTSDGSIVQGTGGTDGIFGPVLGSYGVGNYVVVVRDWYGNVSDLSANYMYYTP